MPLSGLPVRRLLVLVALASCASAGCRAGKVSSSAGNTSGNTFKLTLEATPSTGRVPLTVNMSAVTNDVSLKGATFDWQLGEGATAHIAQPTHTYLTAGAHQVLLDVVAQNGKKAHAQLTLNVDPASPPTLAISPTPQQLLEGKSSIPLAGAWTIVVDKTMAHAETTAQRVENALDALPGVTSTITDATSYFAAHGDVMQHPDHTIYLLLAGDKRITVPFAQRGEGLADATKLLDGRGFGQGYVLFTYGKRIFVVGASAAGVFYGAVTLQSVLGQVKASLPDLVIVDAPDLERRIFYPLKQENKNDPSDPKPGLKLLETMARAKMNGADFSSGSMAQHMDDVFIPYILAAQERFIRPILGPTVLLDLNCAVNGFHVADEPFVMTNGVATPSLPDTPPGFQNLDFETGSVGQAPPGFTQSDNSVAKGQWVLADASAYGGGQCAELKRDASNVNARPKLSQVAAIPPGTWTLAQFRYRTENSSGGGTYQFLLRGMDASGNPRYVHQVNVTPDDGTWHTAAILQSQDPKATRLQIWIRPSATLRGVIDVDSIKLTRVNRALENVLLNSGHTFEVKNAMTGVPYTKDVDYKIVGWTPVTSISALSHPVKVERLPGGAIADGQKLLISYDFLYEQDKSSGRNQSAFAPCGYVTEANYYAKLAAALTAHNISPDDVDIFIGQDEIRGINMDARAIAANVDNATALAMHLNQYIDAVRTSFPNSRVYMWADMLDPHYNGGMVDYQAVWGGKPGSTSPAANALVGKNVEVIPWSYDTKDAFHIIRESARYFNSIGLRAAGGAGGNLGNVEYWSAMLQGTPNDFYGHSNFGTTLDKSSTAKLFGAYSWNTYKGPMGDVAAGGDFELCDGKDDDHDGQVDEGYDLATDIMHCGACDRACVFPHGWGHCASGQCVVDGCQTHYANLDGVWQNGCESAAP